MKRLLTLKTNTTINKNNYKKFNDKYIKIGDDKLWKVYIKR